MHIITCIRIRHMLRGSNYGYRLDHEIVEKRLSETDSSSYRLWGKCWRNNTFTGGDSAKIGNPFILTWLPVPLGISRYPSNVLRSRYGTNHLSSDKRGLNEFQTNVFSTTGLCLSLWWRLLCSRFPTPYANGTASFADRT